jgi:hypothetical protein
VALGGEARELHRRKPEIPLAEIERQQQQVRAFFRDDPRLLPLSTTEAPADASVSRIIARLRAIDLCP